MSTDFMMLATLLGGLIFIGISKVFATLSLFESFVYIMIATVLTGFGVGFIWEIYSESARNRRKRLERIRELPSTLLMKRHDSVEMGKDEELETSIFLPDSVRMKHVHIIGATGSGKTESVILNFLKQDISRGLGAIILDAKGDTSFLRELNRQVPLHRLRVFDLSSSESLGYDPLSAGSPLEAAQRLFSSLTWSEEYYKSKALSALQRIFQKHFETAKRNPSLSEISDYLSTEEEYIGVTQSTGYPAKVAAKDFPELSGLRDQVRMLCLAHLEKILSPVNQPQMNLQNAAKGEVLYFRLQSLLSPQLVNILGKLLINHLAFLAGSAHRETSTGSEVMLTPIYLDEFATFACPEFSSLISKARSAGYALHFSHQSIGDLSEISVGFLNQITDNSSTKIVLRINDPDSADFFARAFGTKLFQKITQRISNVQDIELAEVQGEGTQREAHQFRAAPDLFKTLPTGVGSVLVAHGYETPHGASSVFKIRFPRL